MEGRMDGRKKGREEGRKEGRSKGSINSGPIIAITSQFLADTFQKFLTQFMYKIELFYFKSSFYNIFYYVYLICYYYPTKIFDNLRT